MEKDCLECHGCHLRARRNTRKDRPWSIRARNDKTKDYSHAEIHPSLILGALASCIPFLNHNQAPRNTYQCAMGKQAMGVYVTNYDTRMDKTAYVHTYGMRPLVDTRLMNMIQLNKIPSGNMVIVAIMTYSGYNQEDSILFNQGSLDRGMFGAYFTYLILQTLICLNIIYNKLFHVE